jgi:anti-repressor protein
MSKIQLFNHPLFGELEIIEIDGKPFFGATKTASTLGYVNPHKAIIDHCRRDGVTKREVIDNLGRPQEMNYISEGNLYRLITKSKLPNAEQFESWVFDEILPQIRKHGAYMSPETIERTLTNPDFIIQLATELKSEQQKRLAAESQIALDKPLVLFAESLQVSKDSILVADLAKLLKQNGIDMGEKRLFIKLREEGYLIKSGSEYNMPTQRSMDLKIMEIKVGYRGSSDGTTKITRTPKITGKGQVYFINKFKGHKIAN